MPARATKRQTGRRVGPAALSARVVGHVALEARAPGRIAACFGQHAVDLGQFSADAVDSAQRLRLGLPLSKLGSDGEGAEIHSLIRRLAAHGLLEYRLARTPAGPDDVVIEPQMADYWPRMPQLGAADVVVLSRFAYMRRRGNDLVLESPRAGALFRICNAKIASIMAALSGPQSLARLRGQDGFPGDALLALMVDCQILLKCGPEGVQRSAEGDNDLVLWDFHDLLFHTRSTQGRHANPIGGTYPHADAIQPLPAVRPRWRGKRIDLRSHPDVQELPITSTVRLLRNRHSTRIFDDRRPITLGELAHFLEGTARVQSKWSDRLGDGLPAVTHAARPYPSGGASYPLELYLAVERCAGLAQGFYHYDAGGHALVPIAARPQQREALLEAAAFAMGAPVPPQILITIASRFGRTAWKYTSLAYALVLKEAGVLMQTFYLMATDMGLGGCAIGLGNIDLFARMTGIEFHVEGPVGQFAIGRGLDGAAGGTLGSEPLGSEPG